MSVKPIPDGYHTVSPYLVVPDATALLAFVKAAFDAVEVECMRSPDGQVRHAAVRIGDSMIMMGAASDASQAMPAMLYLYVEDCDAVFAKAVAAGGTVVREPQNEFYGDRNGAVNDSQGNQWWIGTHVEDVSTAELEKRAQEMQGG